MAESRRRRGTPLRGLMSLLGGARLAPVLLAVMLASYHVSPPDVHAAAEPTLRSTVTESESIDYLDVDFVSASTGWVVGAAGSILKTTDGGVTWRPQVSGLAGSIASVSFVDALHGWAVSGKEIIKTSNGGLTWSKCLPYSSSIGPLTSVSFVDTQNGWAVGEMSAVITSDGGTTWREYFAAGFATQDIAVSLASPSTAFAVLGQDVFVTHDAGETYTRTVPNADVQMFYQDVVAVDSQWAWAIGDMPYVIRTTDGGTSWDAVPTGQPDCWLRSIKFIDRTRGWAVGTTSDASGRQGRVLVTADGGDTWTAYSTETTHTLRAVEFVDAETGWIVGDNGTMLRTTDGGGTWNGHSLDLVAPGHVENPIWPKCPTVPDRSDKPLIVFVGGMDSKVTDSDSDPLFGFMRRQFRDKYGYETLIIPSYPKAQALDVIDSAMAYGPTSPNTYNLSAAQRISNRLMWEEKGGRDIILIAHSMGGLISRDYAARWKDLKAGCKPLAIIQLGTPNMGSPLAILGQVKAIAGHDAVQALNSKGSYIDSFNKRRKNAGANQVPVYQFAGTYFPHDAAEDTDWWEFDKRSFTNLLVTHFGAQENDGLVSIGSVFGAPSKGVESRWAISAIHTRAGPWGLWGPDVSTTGVAPHVVPQGFEHDENAVVLVAIRNAVDDVASGRISEQGAGVPKSQTGEATALMAASSAGVSLPEGGAQWQHATRQSIQASEAFISEPFRLEGPVAFVQAMCKEASVEVRLENAEGETFDPVDLDGTMLFEGLESGTYKARVAEPDALSGGEVLLTVVDCGPTRLEVAAPNSCAVGEGIRIDASIQEEGVKRSDVLLSARIDGGTPMAMRDDGISPDQVARDGVFSVVTPSSATSGAAEVEVIASGMNSQEVAFDRVGWALVDVVEPRAALSGTYRLGELQGRSGRVTTVTVDVGVRAASDCDVAIAADVTSSDGSEPLAQVEGGALIRAGEVTTVTVEVPASALAGRLGANNSFVVSSVRLIDMTEGGMSALGEDAPMVTGELALNEMEHAGLTMSVVGSSPSSATVTVLEGDAICTTETIVGAEISFDDGVEWFRAPSSGASAGSVETTWSCAFSLDEGAYVATARALGVAGAIPGTTESIVFTVDRSAPIVEARICDYYPSVSATVTVEASDTVSYVAGVSYRLDGADEVVTANEILELPVMTGAHTIEYWASDAAGNESEHVTRSFVVGEKQHIAAIASLGGAIFPGADTWVDWGGAQTFFITPDPGFRIVDVLVDGESVGPVSEYPFSDVTSGHSIIATFAPVALTVDPIAGSSRYATAIEASKKAFPDGAPCVVIATGSNWPDALGGGALAAAKGGPILLTQQGALPADVLAEIERLEASEAVVLGGEAAVGRPVFDALKAKLGTNNVTRIGGAGRYETAELIAEATVAELGAAYDGTCFVATGSNFPDALGASPLAAAKGWPLLLSGPSGLSASTLSTLDDIGATKALVLGGTAVVPNSVMTQLAGRLPERLEGSGRYGTARVIAEYGVTHAGLGWDKVALATGENFPDALAGGVLQGLDGSVMLLTPGAYLHAEPQAALQANKADIHTVRFLGGESAVKPAARAQVQTVLE